MECRQILVSDSAIKRLKTLIFWKLIVSSVFERATSTFGIFKSSWFYLTYTLQTLEVHPKLNRQSVTTKNATIDGRSISECQEKLQTWCSDNKRHCHEHASLEIKFSRKIVHYFDLIFSWSWNKAMDMIIDLSKLLKSLVESRSTWRIWKIWLRTFSTFQNSETKVEEVGSKYKSLAKLPAF